MGTVKQTITDALRALVVLTEGDEATADQIETGKNYLQDMIAAWSIDGLMVPYQTTETFVLTTGVQSYAWATGQVAPNFNSASPVRVVACTFVIENYRKPLYEGDARLKAQVPLTGNISEPTFFVFNKQLIPLLQFDVAPYGGGVEVVSEKPLDNTLTLTDDMAFPAHYNLLLRYNLAVLLAPEFGQEVGTTLAFNAKEQRNTVQKYNAQAVPTLRHNVPGHRRFTPITLRGG